MASQIQKSPESGLSILRAWTPDGPVHGFLGRLGGVSAGPYSSLNLSYFVGDDPAAVDANWQCLRERLPRHSVSARLNQVHGNVVHEIGPVYDGSRLNGDGMVTASEGVILTIMTADCVPVLMYDAEKRVAAALHAGWRGIVAGISDQALRAMTRLGAEVGKIKVAMGPAIGHCCFEVDADLSHRFEREIRGAAAHIKAGRPGKSFINLKAILATQFAAAGVNSAAITSVGPCTRCAREAYFSRRGANGARTGLQLSFIGLEN